MSLRRRRLLLIGLLAMLASLIACGSFRGLAGKLRELAQLQQQLQHQTGQNNLQASLHNGRYLNLSFVDSSLAKLPSEQKKAKALEVARLAYNDYFERADLASVRVTFETNYDVGPAHYDNGVDSIEFQIPELTAVAPATGPTT
jgi:hypothetical protein